MSKKLFVISDVHGHYTLLKEALDRVGFDKDNENHLLVGCGDYFDRGRENLEVLKFLERLKHKVLLRGNHEDLLLNLFQNGRFLPHNHINGTMTTLESFFGKYTIDPVDNTIDFSGKTSMVNWVCEFIEDTVNYFETEHYVFVHGWLPRNATSPEDRQKATDDDWKEARWTQWIKAYQGHRPLQDKTVVCGHVPTFLATKFGVRPNQADIFYGNGLIAIDAGTFDSKQVNVLVLEDNLI